MMKTFRTLIFILILNIGFGSIRSQTVDNQQNHGSDNTKSSPLNYNVEIGTIFSSNGNFGNSVLFYTKPEIRYALSPKLDINAGVLLVTSNINSYYLAEKKSANNYLSYISAGLNYYPTQKLRISGEILYGMNKSIYSPFENKATPEYYLRFNAEYKITENLSIGLQVINQNLNQIYSVDPFGNALIFPTNRYNRLYGF